MKCFYIHYHTIFCLVRITSDEIRDLSRESGQLFSEEKRLGCWGGDDPCPVQFREGGRSEVRNEIALLQRTGWTGRKLSVHRKSGVRLRRD